MVVIIKDMERASFVCPHVFKNTRPVLLVAHEDDGDWQFLCGSEHQDEGPHVVGMNHVLDHDESLKDLLDLPKNWYAERADTDSPWHRMLLPPED